MPNITKRLVEGLPPRSGDYVVWDNTLKGFGVKVNPSGKKSYVLKYRNMGNQQRKPTLGIHGAVTCEEARDLAKEWLYRISKGEDPLAKRQTLKGSPTVSDLCDRYLREYATPFKKQHSIDLDTYYIEKHIKPRLGSKKVVSIAQQDIIELHTAIKNTPVQANRTRSLLSKMFNLAEDWGLRDRNTNPASGVKKYPEKPKERFLSGEETKRLLKLLETMEAKEQESIYMIALIRLLMLTGARVSEIKDAKWEWVDIKRGAIDLPDSKTGKKTILLPLPAVAILKNLPKVKNNPYVIVGDKEGQQLINYKKPWRRIRKEAEIFDVRVHDLRHSFAALCLEQGIPLYHVGKLLGHKRSQTTQRYAHLAEDPIRVAADIAAGALQKMGKL